MADGPQPDSLIPPTEGGPLPADSGNFDELIPIARPVLIYQPPPPNRNDAILLHDITRRQAWVDISALIALIVLLEFGIAFALSMFFGGTSPDENVTQQVRQEMLLPLISIRAVGAISIVLTLLRNRRQSLASIGLKWRGLLLDIPIGILTLLTAGILTLTVALTLSAIWPAFREQMNRNAELLAELIPQLSVLGLAVLMAIVSVYEEVVFRGFLLPRMRRGLGSWLTALIVSTVVFVIPHAFDQTPAALIQVAMLSIVFSIATILRRSIVPAIVAHMLFNFIVVLQIHSVV